MAVLVAHFRRASARLAGMLTAVIPKVDARDTLRCIRTFEPTYCPVKVISGAGSH